MKAWREELEEDPQAYPEVEMLAYGCAMSVAVGFVLLLLLWGGRARLIAWWMGGPA